LNVLLRKHYRGTDFGAWFSGLVANSPAAYGKIDDYLKQVITDLTWAHRLLRHNAGELERLRPHIRPILFSNVD
jgi:hypothetical protein